MNSKENSNCLWTYNGAYIINIFVISLYLVTTQLLIQLCNTDVNTLRTDGWFWGFLTKQFYLLQHLQCIFFLQCRS